MGYDDTFCSLRALHIKEIIAIYSRERHYVETLYRPPVALGADDLHNMRQTL